LIVTGSRIEKYYRDILDECDWSKSKGWYTKISIRLLAYKLIENPKELSVT